MAMVINVPTYLEMMGPKKQKSAKLLDEPVLLLRFYVLFLLII